jgi:hypothetical protein
MLPRNRYLPPSSSSQRTPGSNLEDYGGLCMMLNLYMTQVLARLEAISCCVGWRFVDMKGVSDDKVFCIMTDGPAEVWDKGGRAR